MQAGATRRSISPQFLSIRCYRLLRDMGRKTGSVWATRPKPVSSGTVCTMRWTTQLRMPKSQFLSQPIDVVLRIGQAPSGALLVEADYVSCRVAEPRSDLGRVRADRLHDLAPIGDDHLKTCRHAVDNDVNKKAGLRGGRAPGHTCAAHLAGRVIKGGMTITALPDVPTEHPCVEVSRARNVGGRNLDVTDLSVRKRGGHRCSFRKVVSLASSQ